MHTTTERRYEELDGGRGRETFFRPMRYRTSDLGPMKLLARLTIGDEAHDLELVDVSQNGLAVRCPRGLVLETGQLVPRLLLSFDGHEAYSGEARVVSLRTVDGSTVVGVTFADALLSIEDVLLMRDIKAWSGDGAAGLALAGRPWYADGHERFKALAADLRLFLEDAQAQLSRLEASLPFHVVHGDLESPARAALIERIRGEMVPPLVAYTEQLDAALRGAGPQEAPALKEYSLRHLHELLMVSPWMRRALHKPLGYPGDFQVMRYVYEDNFCGPTLFAKAVSLAFLETKAALAVKARKELLKVELRRHALAPDRRGRPLRVLSVAAGPAQEVFELLSEMEELPRPMSIVLFEQEREALAYAYTRLKRLVDVRWPQSVSVIYLYDTIKRLLTDRTIFEGCGTFDVVFASGLFDYLQAPTAARLCRNLFANVAPGGTLYVGNMVPENPSRWFMECHLDWLLTYRTHEDMITFARAGVPDGVTRIIEDATRVNPFVAVERP